MTLYTFDDRTGMSAFDEAGTHLGKCYYGEVREPLLL
jgi:hypothetical protein